MCKKKVTTEARPPGPSLCDRGNKYDVIHESVNSLELGIKRYNSKNVVPTFHKTHIV